MTRLSPAGLGRLLALMALLALRPLPALAEGTLLNCTAANLMTALNGGGLVTFNCSGTIALTNAFTITNNTVLQNSGANSAVILTGLTNGQNRFFNVNTGATLTLVSITLANGFSTNGGAIFNNGTLIVTNCVFTNNVAAGLIGRDGANGRTNQFSGDDGGNGTAGRSAAGGAIFNNGIGIVSRTIFQFNNVTAGDGGIGGDGGSGSDTGGNGGDGAAGGTALGGAIHNNTNAVVTFTNCTFIDNSAAGGFGGEGGAAGSGAFPGSKGDGGAGGQASGAGIYNLGTVNVANSTFHINAARSGDSASGGTDSGSGRGRNGPNGVDSRGGAICNLGTVDLLNCTFSDNQVEGSKGGDGGPSSFIGGDGGDGGSGRGGSLYTAGTASVKLCTFAGGLAFGGTNGVGGAAPFAGENGSLGGRIGGNLARNSGTVTLFGTILGSSASGKNASGTVTDLGFNLSSDNTPTLPATGSSINADLRLRALSDNGGFTQTIPLGGGSVALDRIPPGLCPSCPTNDQRGFTRPRPAGGLYDIGALEASGKPVITTQPQNITTTNGAVVTFSVLADGEDLAYQWQFNGTNVTNSTASTFTVFNAQATNMGSYQVIITNSFGAVTSAPPVTLTVLIRPVFTAQPLPTNAVVLQGSNITFQAEVDGTPPLTFQWQRNETNLIGQTTTNITITNVQAADTGSYRLIASNAAGVITSAVATLIVRIPPTFITQPANDSVPLGGDVMFAATVSADPPLSLQWRFNGTNLVGQTSATLSLTNVQPSQGGSYTLFASNSLGTATSQPAVLLVGDYIKPIDLEYSGGTFSLTIASLLGKNYTLEYSDNLETPIWNFLSVQSGTGGLLTFSDPDATSASRFYRIKIDP